MKKFLIERKLPGAGNLTLEEIKSITLISAEKILGLDRPYRWQVSYVTEDAIFCIHEAPSESDVREHAKACRFPINNVYEILSSFGPVNSVEAGIQTLPDPAA